jgi:chloramphenicol-sensitive protein RarD
MTDTRKGILAMIGACLIWGSMPLIYKPLVHVPSLEVVSHRLVWSLVFFSVLLAFRGRLSRVAAAIATPRAAALTFAAALMISINWFLIIFATAVGRNTEGSLGYYIYPLLAVLLGRLLFGERMSRAQWLAVALAAVAVSVLSIGLRAPPGIALALGGSFAVYGVLKRWQRADPVVSVTAELLIFLPVALAVLTWLAAGPGWVFGSHAFETVYMVVAGPVTALPLILFSYAATRVRMATVGLLQYINPTLQFLTAVMLFGEPFSPWHGIAFALIWIALALYSTSAVRSDRAARTVSSAASGSSATATIPASDGAANPSAMTWSSNATKGSQ